MTQLVESLPPETYNVDLAEQTAAEALAAMAFEYAAQLAYRSATAGDGATLLVPGADRRIYIQLGGAGGDVAEALVASFTPALGDSILVQRARLMANSPWLVTFWLQGTALPCY